MDSPKYSRFTVLETTYKVIDNRHNISVYTLIPKTLPPPSSSPRPVMVKFHGGFLITGTALYPDWFPHWLIEYALRHSVVTVLPNYRLAPEARGVEIMEDMHDFWRWLKSDFQAYLDTAAPGTNVDLQRVLCTGESAGGYLSTQSALGSATDGGILLRAAIATYPALDLKSRFYTEEYSKVVLGAPTVPKTVMADHLRALDEDAKNGNRRIVTSATPPERLPLSLSMVQQGLMTKLLGDERVLFPFERVEDVDPDVVSPILIIHGQDDSAVPVEGSEKWVEKAKEKLGDDKVVLVVQPGEHGFDTNENITLETPWLKASLVPITAAWLGSK
ncbi:uncharacterized protein A1O5_09384 [Cladophialophora psammophila CBS 110553]|uniref:Alpha/beta hydrolase fold-3 domain-containing protein n=1 Tax=Cladophialophora psammophila CBS 110553 TaxID=1182543 RepID=W9WRV9_9EURO|nr:uncharacterized protein A1O5_09384 [Cladophialophora psammophila CBS 110553]EXJ67371.1 hypothetical protein A1O5_09384 [Cladophialophora psammophila CBS 110553]